MNVKLGPPLPDQFAVAVKPTLATKTLTVEVSVSEYWPCAVSRVAFWTFIEKPNPAMLALPAPAVLVKLMMPLPSIVPLTCAVRRTRFADAQSGELAPILAAPR